MTVRCLNRGARLGDNVFRKTASRSQAQCRTFTSYKCLGESLAGVPKFSKSSSPELDYLLSTFRTKVFIPSQLSKHHQDLVYRHSNKEKLLSENITVDVAGEPHRLEPIDPCKDTPSIIDGLFSAMSLMQNKSDWESLPRLLKGIKSSGISIKSAHRQKLIRVAGLAGRQDIILECARRVASTGLVLNDPNLVRELMFSFLRYAVESDWDPVRTKKALSWAEMTVELLEDSKHANRKITSDDARVDGRVVGIILDLAATRASLHLKGRDIDGKVALYTRRLLGTSTDFSVPSPLSELSKDEINHRLLHTVPTLHGLKGAENVLGQTWGVKGQLASKIAELDRVNSALFDALSVTQVAGSKRPLGLYLAEKLFAT